MDICNLERTVFCHSKKQVPIPVGSKAKLQGITKVDEDGKHTIHTVAFRSLTHMKLDHVDRPSSSNDMILAA